MQKPIEHTIRDVQRVRDSNPVCDRHCAPPCEGPGVDRFHHEAKAEACFDAVAFAEPPERPVVCQTPPSFLTTHQAEAVVERDA